MKLFDSLKRNTDQTLPRLAGGAPEVGERLYAASKYMEPEEAEAAVEIVAAWRNMPRSEYDAFARSL
jgi:hypothetical protein